ncbi:MULTISPECIES: hypothetical protein [unclassified Streptomyces]|uniref:hypothetical protein n=1 Tax=unclassified Streptomyces TaxID=2593676 RepID=UPI00225426B9|nr:MULTISPECIES: hypothetical protein [unclassified Streptomyces]MCX4527077.1 hypothetical protein [Streptomyces sp. NBC_01551]MCX4542347.1 hypothetical protein [Streptomyces sp. NBC_01565]
MRSTRRTARRTTLRTAAVLTGAAAVLAVPVGAAFADSPAGPGAESEASPGVERPTAEPTDPTGPAVPETTPPVTTPPVTTPAEPTPTTPTTPAKPTKPTKPVRAFVATVKLADGSVAKVYKIGDRHFEADILAGSTKLDTLVSRGGAAAYGQNNGLHVVLQPDGTVRSWMEGGEKPKPVEDRVTSVRVTMPDGRIAKLIDGPGGKRAVISTPNGNVLGTIDLKHPSVLNDGWTYKLVQDGKRGVKFVVIDGKSGGNSWVYDFGSGKLIEKYTVGEKRKKTVPVPVPAAEGRVVPKGGVKAGAEGVGGAGGTDAPHLVAAGGGMAAVGAAGLGFAVLRRA